MSRHWLAFGAKLLCSLAVLTLVLGSLDREALWAAIVAADLRLLMLAVVMFYPTQLIGAHRWFSLLRTLGATSSYPTTVRYSFLGQFSALFLPGQISGDVVRTVAMAQHGQEPAQSLLSVALDKLSFLFAIALFALIGSLASPVLLGLPGLVLGACALCTAAFAGVLSLARFRNFLLIERSIPATGALPGWLVTPLQRFLPVLAIPALPYHVIALVIGYACSLQALNTLGSLILARAMGIVIHPLDWAAVNAVVALVQVLPISIGGLGVREGTFVWLLGLYGVSQIQAAAYSLMTFALVAMLISLGWLAIEGVRALRHRGELIGLGASAAGGYVGKQGER